MGVPTWWKHLLSLNCKGSHKLWNLATWLLGQYCTWQLGCYNVNLSVMANPGQQHAPTVVLQSVCINISTANGLEVMHPFLPSHPLPMEKHHEIRALLHPMAMQRCWKLLKRLCKHHLVDGPEMQFCKWVPIFRRSSRHSYTIELIKLLGVCGYGKNSKTE